MLTIISTPRVVLVVLLFSVEAHIQFIVTSEKQISWKSNVI
jgi:uncharacterized GH25 family protein